MSDKNLDLKAWRSYVKNIRAKRFETKKCKCRSVRELAHYLACVKTVERLDELGVAGTMRTCYTAFVRKILGEVFNNGAEFLDILLDCYEQIWMERFDAKPEILREVEFIILTIIENLDKVELEYLRLHNPELYKEHLEHMKEEEREEAESLEELSIEKRMKEILKKIRQKYRAEIEKNIKPT